MILTANEVNRLLEALPPHEADVARLALLTALRPAELFSLTREQLQPASGVGPIPSRDGLDRAKLVLPHATQIQRVGPAP